MRESVSGSRGLRGVIRRGQGEAASRRWPGVRRPRARPPGKEEDDMGGGQAGWAAQCWAGWGWQVSQVSFSLSPLFSVFSICSVTLWL